MPGLIHPIELREKLKSNRHLFLPPLQWDLSTVASAMQMVSILRKDNKEAQIIAPETWKEYIPESWPEDFLFLIMKIFLI